MNPICGRCLKPIDNPAEQADKRFVVEKTGRVILLRRHDACASSYAPGGIRQIDDDEARRFCSPAMVRSRGLRERRASAAPEAPSPGVDMFSKLRANA